VAVVIVFIEILNVLSSDTGFTIFAVTRAINTDTVEGDSIASLEACPSTQASEISASTFGIVADVAH
jgi:hypothetical protein